MTRDRSVTSGSTVEGGGAMLVSGERHTRRIAKEDWVKP
jgi:hypothetical protein